MVEDAFQQNISGVASLIGEDTNKTSRSDGVMEEGVKSDLDDVLELPMDDKDLLILRDEYEQKSNTYLPKIKARQDRNKAYIRGVQRSMTSQDERPIPTNLLFEATATFIPQSLAKNPEPVVFSDNTDEGKQASNDLKTMLQYHADILCLRQKLGKMVWHWSIYFTGVVKHGWDEETNDIITEIRKPQNFVLDPDGYVDEFGDFKGEFVGERIESTAEKVIDLYPKHKDTITLKVSEKLGTKIVRTEWWNDEYSFTTFEELVLDKHKNEFFNYGTEEKTDEEGAVTQTATPGINHFAIPKMPFTFLSVFSLQDRPHDFTNLIEQNIANQDRITDRDTQIDKNLSSGQNSVLISGISFTEETAGQAVQSFYEEGFTLIPDGNMEGVRRVPASPLPSGILETQQVQKQDLRSIYGTLGSTANTEPDQRVRNTIVNQQHDATRNSGGVGESLEQVAKNIFNWWTQLYCVFYDEAHYGAVIGNARAVEYVQLSNSVMERKFVVSVSPNSMAPKDEISERNEAIELANTGWLDPINLYKKLDDPDPMNTAKMVAMWRTNPQQYMLTFFPEVAPPQPVAGEANPQDMAQPPQPQNESLAAKPANPALSQVPIKNLGVPSPFV